MACKWNVLMSLLLFLLLRKPNDKTYGNNLETRLEILWCNIQILQYYGFVYILVLWHWLTASTLGHTNFPEMIVNICHCGLMNFSYPCRNLTLPYKIYLCNKFHHSINIYGLWHTWENDILSDSKLGGFNIIWGRFNQSKCNQSYDLKEMDP